MQVVPREGATVGDLPASSDAELNCRLTHRCQYPRRQPRIPMRCNGEERIGLAVYSTNSNWPREAIRCTQLDFRRCETCGERTRSEWAPGRDHGDELGRDPKATGSARSGCRLVVGLEDASLSQRGESGPRRTL